MAKKTWPLTAGLNAHPSADPFYPRFWLERLPQDKLHDIDVIKRLKPMGVFVCDMGELFGDWVPLEWQQQIFRVVILNPWHRFYLLTKQPQNLVKFSPFSRNCWVGITATNSNMLFDALNHLDEIQCSIRYVSLEPLLGDPHLTDLSAHLAGSVDWVIIGSLTGSYQDLIEFAGKDAFAKFSLHRFGNKYALCPPVEWVEEIESACNKAGIAVFEKNNLNPLLDYNLRQEMPKLGVR